MAQSPEYPDLLWMPPKSWTNANRTEVQLIVIHDTEGSSHAQSAEDGAAYDQRRDDGTSTHYFVDSNSVVQCVRTNDQAHTARRQGNRRGIQYELCAKASFSKSKWLDPAYGLPMLRLAAKQVSRDCDKWDIPIRKLTVAQVAAGVKGICGHVDITYAFPQDNGSHTDPGPNFPWTEFIQMIKDAQNKTTGDLMALTDAQQKEMYDGVKALAGALPYMDGRLHSMANGNDTVPTGYSFGKAEGGPVWIVTATKAVQAAIAALATGDAARAQEILAAIDQVDEAVVAALGEDDLDALERILKEELSEEKLQELASRLITTP